MTFNYTQHGNIIIFKASLDIYLKVHLKDEYFNHTEKSCVVSSLPFQDESEICWRIFHIFLNANFS